MQILVIGPGALGIVAAVKLHKAGYDVEVAVRNEEKALRLNQRGLTMTDPHGQDHLARIQCVWDPETSGSYDLIIHTTKLHVAEDVMHTWLPTLDDDGFLVPFQNGVAGDRLRTMVGPRRFMECSVYWPATLMEEGWSMHTGSGHNVIGPWPDGVVTHHHERIAAVLDHVAPTQTSPQMRGVKWSKLAINAAMTSCGVVTGATLGQMIRNKACRQAFLGVIRETVAVMEAAGIPVIRVGPSKPDVLAKLPDWAARIVLMGAARRYGKSRSSSSQSVLRGERSEVDYLNGLVSKVGKGHGVATPVNDAVVETVHGIEEGRLEQGFATVETMMREIP